MVDSTEEPKAPEESISTTETKVQPGSAIPSTPPDIKPSPIISTDASLVDSLINQAIPPQHVVQTSSGNGTDTVSPIGSGIKPKKHSKIGILIAGFLVLLITLPIGIYFISQRNTQLTEVRSKAALESCNCAQGETLCKTNADGEKTGYLCTCLHFSLDDNICDYRCTTFDPVQCVPAGVPDGPTIPTPPLGSCEKFNAEISGRCIKAISGETITELVGKYKCEGNPTSAGCTDNPQYFSNVTGSICFDTDWCGTQQIDVGGDGTCYLSTYECSQSPTPTSSENTPIPTVTPTPIIGQCTRIHIYKDGEPADLNAMSPGDIVEIAVAGTDAGKGRIRVNGGAWEETSEKNTHNEYFITHTIVSSVTTYVVEAEIFTNNEWK